MLKSIDKILFCTDLSSQSRQAFEYAASIACRHGATIILLYVSEDTTAYAGSHVKGFLGEERWQELKDAQENQARQILIGKKREGDLLREALGEFCRIAKAELGEENVPTDDIIVVSGNVVDEILSISDKQQCQLIVMGHHTRGKLGDAVLGSTTRRILRRSRIPVLLVPIDEEED